MTFVRRLTSDQHRQHIELVEAVNNAKAESEHRMAEARLRGWRDGLCAALRFTSVERGTMLGDADWHYLDQGIERDMCCGVWLDWEPEVLRGDV